jgi:lactoylglutathione lyase
MTDGAIDLALMVYDSEDAPEAQLSGVGPCIHHWGAEVDDINVAAEKIKELGGEVMSPLDRHAWAGLRQAVALTECSR